MSKKPRTLVLCFDGTSNEYDSDNTNVVKFHSLLKKDNPEQQLCYYQAGIGTFFEPGSVRYPWLAKMLDLAIAWYLDQHVMNGYKFLMQNYRAGDKICIFGFSRGAYTARALAGMLYKVGLLPKDNPEQIAFAMKLYKRQDPEGIKLSQGFKQTFCSRVKVEFVGVWDTVSSVGILTTRTLPFTNSNQAIATFRHALALDERRSKFRANNYHRTSPTEDDARLDPEHGSFVPQLIDISTHVSEPGSKSPGKSTMKSRSEALEAETNVKEVWFAGDHCDVGGGNVLDSEDNALSNIPLRWMVKEVIESNAGIVFEGTALKAFHVDLGITQYFHPAKDGRIHIASDDEGTLRPGKVVLPPANGSQRPSGINNIDAVSVGPEKSARQKAEIEIMAGRDKDYEDVNSPCHDALKRTWLWWILELLPTKYSWQDDGGKWYEEFTPHLGKGRVIQAKKPLFHFSVRERMGLGYVPRAQWEEGSEEYVD